MSFNQGKVDIAANPGVKLEIPDGAVIENKVIYFWLTIFRVLVVKLTIVLTVLY